MRIRTLVAAAVLVFLASAGDAHAGWFNWGHGYQPPEPAHPIWGGFHRSDSEGKGFLKPRKEFDNASWGATSKHLLNHPIRPASPYLRLK